MVQLISMAVVAAWAFVTGYAMFWLLDKAMGLRASPEDELEGLDRTEHGILAYPETAGVPDAVGASASGD